MILKQIVLKNYRNFSDNVFSFDRLLTIVIGENARGKTNLLESVYVSIHGYGFRESREEELIMFDRNASSIASECMDDGGRFQFEVVLKRRGEGVEKNFMINRSKKKYAQFYRETPKAVLFSPEQLDIIIGSPEVRRTYFNKLISSFDLEYKKRVLNYDNALRKRNKILESHSFDRDLYDELVFWNDYLEEQGIYITQKRQQYVDFLNKHTKIQQREFSIKYQKNEFTKERLKTKLEDEKRYRKTLIGPQKDEFQIFQKGVTSEKNIHHFGSRSEQRLGVFWLKFNEVRYLELKQKIKPLIFLDDIFSELDTKNSRLIVDVIRDYQTIITTTEEELLDLVGTSKSIIRL